MSYAYEPIETLHQEELCAIEHTRVGVWDGVWVLGMNHNVFPANSHTRSYAFNFLIIFVN